MLTQVKEQLQMILSLDSTAEMMAQSGQLCTLAPLLNSGWVGLAAPWLASPRQVCRGRLQK
jgi:hypothetical protein